MRHEKIIKRPNGDRYRLIASVYIDTIKGAVWGIDVSRSPAGKRTWFCVVSTDDFVYRRLSLPDREKHRLSAYLEHVTAEEILAAKMELWEKLKPE